MKTITTNLFHIKNKALRIAVNSSISTALTFGLICLVRFTHIPNPNLILMTGLVVITALFGFVPGLFPTGGMILYSFYFFSTKNDFVTFTETNMAKVVVAIVTGILCYAFVGLVNFLYERSAISMMNDVAELSKDNEHLKWISKTDALTSTKNRFSLRHDFPSYVGKEIQVMIFDVDDFKHYNDTYGHLVGDGVLSSVSHLTKEIFEEESVYRYGGDEFVVIKTHLSLSEFKGLVDELRAKAGEITVGKEKGVRLSIGYTYGLPEEVDDLRRMIRYADELMYSVKGSTKDGVEGRRFGLDI